MSFDWKQQTVIITGAYGGLGKELCYSLNKRGANLVITGRDNDKLQQLRKNLTNSSVVVGDVNSEEFITELLAHTVTKKSKGHILINNAGISSAAFLSQQSINEIKMQLDINLLAPIMLSKFLMPWLKTAQSGKIINIGSTFGAIGYPGFSLYSASKFGLHGFSQALNRELTDTSVSVQYLAPRAIATNINSDKVNELNNKLKNAVDKPEHIVPQIIAAIEKNKSEKFFGFPEKIFTKINALFPSVVSNAINKEHKTIKQILSK
jgi:short-subunit dehydrogenase